MMMMMMMMRRRRRRSDEEEILPLLKKMTCRADRRSLEDFYWNNTTDSCVEIIDPVVI